MAGNSAGARAKAADEICTEPVARGGDINRQRKQEGTQKMHISHAREETLAREQTGKTEATARDVMR